MGKRKLNHRDRKRIKRLCQRVKAYLVNDREEPTLDYLEIRFMDRCIETWVAWSSGSGVQQPVSMGNLVGASTTDNRSHLVNLSEDELVAVDHAIVKRSRYEREIIEIEYRTFSAYHVKAEHFNLSPSEFRETVNVLLNDMYQKLMPEIGEWRERSLERA